MNQRHCRIKDRKTRAFSREHKLKLKWKSMGEGNLNSSSSIAQNSYSLTSFSKYGYTGFNSFYFVRPFLILFSFHFGAVFIPHSLANPPFPRSSHPRPPFGANAPKRNNSSNSMFKCDDNGGQMRKIYRSN